MFKFLTPKAKTQSDPLETPRDASAWYRHLPVRDVIGRQQHVVRVLDSIDESGRTVDLERIAAVEWLDDQLAADRNLLVRQFIDNAPSSGQIADRVWRAAYDLSQAFIRAYGIALAVAVVSAGGAQWKRAIPQLFARVLRFYGLDTKLRLLRGEPWIPAKWSELHRIYQQALDLGVERTRVPNAAADSGGDSVTVEQEYLAVLLTHLLNMGTLTSAEIVWASTRVRAWCSGLALEPAPSGATGGFCVDLGSKMGLVRSTGEDRVTTLRYVGSEAIVEQLEQDIAALQRPDSEDADGSRLSKQQRLSVLEKMRPVITEGAHASPNRQPRTVLNVAADMRVGLTPICQQLAGRGEGAEAEDVLEGGAASSPASGAIEASDDALRPDEKRARGGMPAMASPESLWLIEDRSATGLRLVGKIDVAPALTLGSLVAVRELRKPNWVLGVVRRLSRTTTTLDVGVSIIAVDPIPVTLHAKRHAREDMGFVVDGIDVSTIGTPFHGLYLRPPSRPENPVTVRTLMIPTSEYAHGRRVVLITPRSVITVAVNKSFEQRPEWTWAGIEVMQKAPRG